MERGSLADEALKLARDSQVQAYRERVTVLGERSLANETYDARRQALVNYLKSAISVSDWHAVSDAANDLRVLEAYHQGRKAEK